MTNSHVWPPPTGPAAQLAPRPASDPTMRVAWWPLPFQVVLTGFLSYVVIVAWTAIDGSFTEGLQIVGLAFYSTFFTVAMFLIGLPLRTAGPVRRWWIRHAPWAFALVGLSILGIFVAYHMPGAHSVHYARTADWPATDGFDPNYWLFLPSLLGLGVSCMHLLPPTRKWRTRNT